MEGPKGLEAHASLLFRTMVPPLGGGATIRPWLEPQTAGVGQ